ncbi:MAG: hypothetical protein ACYCOU_09905 [Sulfobacillus sp.]
MPRPRTARAGRTKTRIQTGPLAQGWRPVLFIYTNSFDLSSDVLIRRLGDDAVFRFNLDLWQEYRIEIDRHHISITNPNDRKVESKDISKFLWRKPLTNQQLYPDRTFPRESIFEEEELAYAMREIWNAMYYTGRAVLIDPLSDTVAGKLLQAQIARQYFSVPDWKVTSGTAICDDAGTQHVAKSFTSRRTADRSVLFTTCVDAKQLSPSSPWFLQSYVPAEDDVTVVAVRDTLFAFSLGRAEFPAGVVDWRRARILAPEQKWVPHELPRNFADSIRRFMGDMSLHYGRLDFLLNGSTYHFLEVNPNGEWGWLDPLGESGIVDALEKELSPDTVCHALPNPRRIQVEHRLMW